MDDETRRRLMIDRMDETFKLQGATAELEAAQSNVNKIKYRIDYIETLLGEKRADAALSHPPVRHRPPPKVVESGKGETPQWIKQVLEEAGTPLKLGDIVNRVIQSGVAGSTSTKHLANRISSVLYRNPKTANPIFYQSDRGTWDLVSRRKSH